MEDLQSSGPSASGKSSSEQSLLQVLANIASQVLPVSPSRAGTPARAPLIGASPIGGGAAVVAMRAEAKPETAPVELPQRKLAASPAVSSPPLAKSFIGARPGAFSVATKLH
jgi:hypothetical protein